MGVSSTARLPSLGAQSIPPLFSHLQHTSNASVVARWSITIRSFRAVPVPTNAWPPANQYDSSFSATISDDASLNAGTNLGSATGPSAQAGSLGSAATSSGGAGSSASGAPPLTKPRTMWQVWLSDHPGVVFVIIEDTGRSSRAKVWRDWEVSTKKWKKHKRREIEARRKQEAQKEAEQTLTQSAEGSKIESDEKPAGQADSSEQDKAEPMVVDIAASSTAEGTIENAAAQAPSNADAGAQQAEAGSETKHDPEQEPIETAGPKPKLRLPSHTRYTVSALTSSMSAMLTGLNLPPPHGAPVGTAGPGAWVPRGAAVSIEGLMLEINSQSLNALPGISPALASVSTTEDAALLSRSSGGSNSSNAGVDWRVRVGSVMGGGGRSAGAIVEAEFLPASTLLPTSKFLHDFLHSLFPPGLVPMPAPVAPMSAPGMPNINSLRGTTAPSRVGSATGTPRSSHATLGAAPAMNGNAAATAAGAVANGSGFSYTIGGGAGAGAAPPNRNFNIPVVSDQLWEEVVPRSGESWRKRIAKRSQQMRVSARMQRSQRKNAVATSSGEQNGSSSKELNGDTDAFGWHTFGSDDDAETAAPSRTNGTQQNDTDEELSSSDSEAEPTLTSGSDAAPVAGGLTGTAVTMQQVDEDDDDDDDDDRPLGAPTWLSSAKRTSSASNVTNPPSTAAAVKREDTAVQLLFQGLRSDDVDAESSAEQDGWSGIERGRRIAFQYVQMLRAEGII
ncbi:conserved hypothetical protein [Sporisorium reilianum SRZ2]|uniref:Uncharacterized protein n=1 Tax=Sporisorium reilianum (strain SRZ2) TaxID=999809 RepID=E6ZWY5_SPORE|nr:conserved hypothetical protein [Sporisorium reilianum SRZ2]